MRWKAEVKNHAFSFLSLHTLGNAKNSSLQKSTLFDIEFNVQEVLVWGLKRMIQEVITSEL